MSHALTPSGSYNPTVTVPDPGDPRNAASVQVPFQALADSVDFVFQGVGTIQAARFTPRVNEMIAITGAKNTDSAWAFAGGIWFQATAGTGHSLFIDFTLDHAAAGGNIQLNGVKVWIEGTTAGGTHSALPVTLPKLWLASIDPTLELVGGASIITHSSLTDTSASFAAYNLPHSISITGLTLPFASNRRYWIQLDGESGTNSVNNGLALLAAAVSYSPGA